MEKNHKLLPMRCRRPSAKKTYVGTFGHQRAKILLLWKHVFLRRSNEISTFLIFRMFFMLHLWSICQQVNHPTEAPKTQKLRISLDQCKKSFPVNHAGWMLQAPVRPINNFENMKKFKFFQISLGQWKKITSCFSCGAVALVPKKYMLVLSGASGAPLISSGAKFCYGLATVSLRFGYGFAKKISWPHFFPLV